MSLQQQQAAVALAYPREMVVRTYLVYLSTYDSNQLALLLPLTSFRAIVYGLPAFIEGQIRQGQDDSMDLYPWITEYLYLGDQ